MAWLLRSPHTNGLHVAVRTLPGSSESTAHVAQWKQDEGRAEVIDAQLLPAGIKAISWDHSDESKPLLFAACTTDAVHVIDLANKTSPWRSQAEYTQSDKLGSHIVWAGAGRHIVVSRGGFVSSLDAERGARVWNFPARVGAGISTSANVASIAKVTEHEIIASWMNPDDSLGSIHMLDLRMRPELLGEHAGKMAIALDTHGVHGLCCSMLDPHTAASYSRGTSQTSSSDVHLWDLRYTCKKSDPVRQLHSESGKLNFGANRQCDGLEWSPSKRSTLLALAGADSNQRSLHTCRLFRANAPDEMTDTIGIDRHVTESLPSWSGQASPLHALGDESVQGSEIVAANWAHSCSPGAVILLRGNGTISAAMQRSSRLCAWSPRGGGFVVKQWQQGERNHSASSSGVPVVVESDANLANADVTSLMRLRAERSDYGVRRLPYDDYTKAMRGIGPTDVTTEAVATAWQWIKLVDNADGDDDGDADVRPGKSDSLMWKGVRELLNKDEGAEPVEQFPGVYSFSSDGRRLALQTLGFPEHELASPQASVIDSSIPLPDEVVRRVLRAVLWFQFKGAAAECESLDFGPSGRLFLSHFVLVLHAAACLFLSSGSHDRDDDDSRSQTVKAALQACLNLGWQDIPFAATLRLALQFIEVVITSLNLGMQDRRSMQSPFLENVRALLGRPAPNTVDGRTAVCFRAALALRFLAQDALEGALERLCSECIHGGLLDGLCLMGLGGGDATSNTVTASTLEDLLQNYPLPAAPVSASQLLHYGLRGRQGGGGSKGSSPAEPHINDDGAVLVAAYVERTGDLQTAALLMAHTVHLAQPPNLKRFLAQYAALLARWQLYRERAGLHSLLAARLPPDESSVPRGRSAVLQCYYCNDPLTGEVRTRGLANNEADTILRRCPNVTCNKAAPSCAVCLLPIFVVKTRSGGALALNNWVAWCEGCHHGGHMEHLEDWFSKHDECPVAGCDCKCNMY